LVIGCEKCADQGRLGAAYFFLRSSPSHNPQALIPSLAYQLAVNVPNFKNVLGHAIFQDPSIFHKALRIQLQKLIVEPFVLLQDRKPELAQNPLFIIIDGLDECEGIEAQCEIVEMIEEVVRLKKGLPLRWLIASRPEFHLQYTFSQPDFAIDYHKEVLLIDADTEQDVNLYLQHYFEKIRIKSSIKAPWPFEVDLRKLENIAQVSLSSQPLLFVMSPMSNMVILSGALQTFLHSCLRRSAISRQTPFRLSTISTPKFYPKYLGMSIRQQSAY
jgi:hypothetical protein